MREAIGGVRRSFDAKEATPRPLSSVCCSFYSDFTRDFNLLLPRNQIEGSALAQTSNQQFGEKSMSRPHLQERTKGSPLFVEHPRTMYQVVRQEDVWFIKFDSADYGPYKSEREAMLFAVDAANKLGEQGQDTQVLVFDENGETGPAWTFGRDPYPPRL